MDPVARTIAIFVFIIIILASILTMLIGYFRGLHRTGTKTVTKIILILIWVFVTPVISKSLIVVDLSRFNFNNFTVNGKEIIFTSIGETLANIFAATGLISPMNGINVYALSITITEISLCYVIFFVLMIFTQLSISGISAVIYNGVFRWFIQVESYKENYQRRKREKEYKQNSKALKIVTKGLINPDGSITDKREKKRLLRIPGAILGLIQEFVFLLVLLSPITSAIRIVNKNKDDIISFINRISPSEIQELDSFDKTINSLYNTPTFKLYEFNKEKPLDTLLMNQISKQNLYGINISLDTFISSIVDVANPIITKDIFTYEEGLASVTANYSILLSTSTINSILSSILLPENEAFFALIPPLIDISLAITSANSNFRIDNLDFSNINWNDDINAIKEVYSQVYSMLIDSIIVGKEIDIYNFLMKTSTYSDQDINALTSAAYTLGKTDLIKKNAPIVFSSLGTILSANGYDIFPTNKEAYQNIKWEDELSLYANALFKLLRVIEVDITGNMNFNYIQEKLSSAIKDKDKRKNIQDILCGENGLIYSETFKVINRGNALLATFDYVLSNNTYSLNKYIKLASFRNEMESFNNKSIDEIKSEISNLFLLLDIICNNDNPIYWDENNNIANIKKFDADVAKELYELLQIAQYSNIFSSLYPSVIQNYLLNNYSPNNVQDYMFGLSPFNFNYSDPDFIEDLSKIILILPTMIDMYNAFNSNRTNTVKFNSIDIPSLRVFLNVLINSDFFNPNLTFLENKNESKNNNIRTVLNYLFSTDIFKNLNLILTTKEEIESANWGVGSSYEYVSEQGKIINLPLDEIESLCFILECSKKNPDFLGSNLDSLSLSSFELIDDFDALFDLGIGVINSDLFKNNGVNLFFDKVDNYLKERNIPFNFNQLRNYAYDDKNKYKIIEDLIRYKELSYILKDLDYNKLNINNKDYIREVPITYINSILTYIGQSYFNNESTSDVVGDVLYLLMHRLDLINRYSLIDYSNEIFSIKNTSTSSWIKEKERTFYIINDDTFFVDITTSGTIRNITSFFDIVRKQIYLNEIRNREYKGLDFRKWISNEINLEESQKESFFSDIYLRRLSYIYSGFVFKKFNKIMPNLPEYTYDIYKRIDTSLLFNLNDLSGLELANEIYNLNEFIVIMTTKIGEDSVFSYFKDFEKYLNIGNVVFENNTQITEAISLSLNKLASSKLLTTRNTTYDLSPLGYGLYNLLENNDGLVRHITMGKSDDEGKYELYNLISIIDNDTNISWSSEFDKYTTILDTVVNNGFSLDDYSLINDNKNSTNIRTIYDNLNASTLLHKVVIYRIKNIYDLFDFDTYIKNNNGNIIYQTNFNIHLTSSNSDYNYWKNSYDYIIDLLDSSNNALISLLENKLLNTFNSDTIEIMYALGSMSMFKYSNNYIAYNLMKNSSDNIINYLHDVLIPIYLEDTKITRLNEILFNNELLYLNNSFSNKCSNYNNEIALVKDVLDYIKLKEVNNLTLEEFKSNYSDDFFATLFSKTYSDTYRSYFASEIVSGLVTTLFNSTSEIQSFLNTYANIDYYGIENNISTYENITSEFGYQIDTYINNN